MHLDGARLWQCTAAYQRSLAEIADLFDSVYVSFYKDLGGISGAVLAGDTDFIAQARIWQRRAGGNLISLYPYIVAARQGLTEHLPQMPQRLAQAQWLAAELNRHASLATWPRLPQTNMFRLRIDCDPVQYLTRATEWMAQRGVALLPAPYEIGEQHVMCECTIGDAFGLQSRQHWQQHLADFTAFVLAERE